MKYSFFILIYFLIVTGCSKEATELERCIKANTLQNNYEEKWSNHLENLKDLNWNDNADELWEIINNYNSSLNSIELVNEACDAYSEETLIEQYPETEYMTDEEFDVWSNSESAILFLENHDRDCNEKVLRAIKEDKDRAKAFCHRQGIY